MPDSGCDGQCDMTAYLSVRERGGLDVRFDSRGSLTSVYAICSLRSPQPPIRLMRPVQTMIQVEGSGTSATGTPLIRTKVMPPVPLPGSTGSALTIVATDPEVPLKVLVHCQSKRGGDTIAHGNGGVHGRIPTNSVEKAK